MRSSRRLSWGLALALCFAAPLAAQAPVTFNACFVPGVGAIYLVGQAGLPGSCLANHVALSWSSGGAGGSVTSVAAGSGLTGGTITSSGTLAVDFAGPGAAATVARSDHTHSISTTNIAVGNGALLMNTTGGQNTAVGSNALRNNSVGDENTVVGAGGMDASAGSAGSFNTALGAFTLRSAAGDNNTAVGSRALTSLTTGTDNTAVGRNALTLNLTGTSLTAVGSHALASNTGQDNTAIGTSSMINSTTGSWNTAVGGFSLMSATGNFNTAIGWGALVGISSGTQNTALGFQALQNTSSGNNNIAVGVTAGSQVTTGSFNIHIGHGGAAESNTIRIGNANQNRAFVAGIRGVTTGAANAVAVLIDANGQLGTINSSARFKDDIHDMGDVSRALLDLRPVTFRYLQPLADGSRPVEYGLIAEEVERAFPALVAHGADGRAETVRYHVLPSLLLNEVQRQERELVSLRQEMDRLSRLVAEQAALLAELRKAAKP